MKTVFDKSAYEELVRRLDLLQPDSVRRWGTMEPAQMMAHISRNLDINLGKIAVPSESNFFMRMLIRRFVVATKMMPRNSPTARAFTIDGPRDFADEKRKLLSALLEVHRRGAGGDWSEHPAFGRLTGEELGRLTYKHVNHHLRQFGC